MLPEPPIIGISPKTGTSERFNDPGLYQEETECPRAEPPDTFFETAAATVGAGATGVTNVMGKTIGEIQDAIESITNPESDDERELGIGTDTRARLAAQAKLANEQRDKNNRTNGGVADLVYSDESDDEEEDATKTSRAINTNGLSTEAVEPERTLEPALPLPATPPLSQAEYPHKPPHIWTVNDVVDWAKVKGFDGAVCQRFTGEF